VFYLVHGMRVGEESDGRLVVDSVGLRGPDICVLHETKQKGVA
jgi:hypothetical protein